MRIDPAFAWNTFQRLTAINEQKERDEKRKRKRLRQLRTGAMFPRGAIGPPGPRGPPGPCGPKGANVTKEEMFEEFRTMLRELAANKLIITGDPRCTELCVSNLEGNDTGPTIQKPLFGDSHDLLVPKMVTSFMWELKDFVTVPKKSLVELDSFVRSFRSGSYEQGTEHSKAISGRFFVSRTGFYTFYIRAHLQLPKQENGNVVTGDDLFSVLLCIEALCRENLNLETMSGFGPGQKTTVSVSGMLHLEIGQYVSVFIDNNSRYPVHVFEGSQFSGHLTGI